MEIIKLNNKDLIENMLKQLPTIGFTPQDVEFDSSYFVAYMGENSVCQFHIKEIPGFLFGIWTADILDIKTLNYPKNTELVIFTQYEAELNKFKPSRSGFVTPLNRCIDNVLGVDVVMWDFWKLEHILNFMKKHPIKSWFYVSTEMNYIWQERSSLYILKDFISYKVNKFKIKLFEKVNYNFTKRYIKHILRKLRSTYYIFIDEGENCYPRLEVNFRSKENVNVNNYLYDSKLIDKLNTKHFINNLTVQYYEGSCIENGNIIYDDEDVKLKKRFYEMISKYKNYSEDELKELDINIISCNL